MNKKELKETVKIIYDALCEEKDVEKTIKELNEKNKLYKILITKLSQIIVWNVQNSKLNPIEDVTPFEINRFLNEFLKHNADRIQTMDDKFIDELINL